METPDCYWYVLIVLSYFRSSYLFLFHYFYLGNGKSGSNEACHILSSARKVLNAVQAIDLSDQEPKIALQLCALLKETQCRLLIAGGDGTIAWVLNAVQDLDVKVYFFYEN